MKEKPEGQKSENKSNKTSLKIEKSSSFLNIKDSINFYLKNYNIDKEYKEVPHSRLFICFILFIIFYASFFFSSLFSKDYIENSPHKTKPLFILSIYAFLTLLSFIFSFALYKFFVNLCYNFHYNFFKYYLHNNFNICIFSFSLSAIVIEAHFFNDHLQTLEVFQEINNIIKFSSKFSVLLLIKALIIDFLNYSIYIKHHKLRLEELSKIKKILILISNIEDGNINYAFEWSKSLFNKLKSENNQITLNSLESRFTREQSEEILKLYDSDNNNFIDKREWNSSNTFWIKKMKNLEQSILGSHKSVNSIETLLITTIGIILLQMFKSFFIGKTPFLRYAVWFELLIIPLSSVIITIATEIFLNVHVFYFLRPFDIGDKIEIDKEMIKCEKINFLSSEYEKSNMKMKLLNKPIIQKEIINYRMSEYSEIDFKRTFNYKNPEKIEDLEKCLNEEAERNKDIFMGKIKFLDYQIKENKVSLVIRVSFKIKEYDSLWYYENIGEFSKLLYKEINKREL